MREDWHTRLRKPTSIKFTMQWETEFEPTVVDKRLFPLNPRDVQIIRPLFRFNQTWERLTGNEQLINKQANECPECRPKSEEEWGSYSYSVLRSTWLFCRLHYTLAYAVVWTFWMDKIHNQILSDEQMNFLELPDLCSEDGTFLEAYQNNINVFVYFARTRLSAHNFRYDLGNWWLDSAHHLADSLSGSKWTLKEKFYRRSFWETG